MNTFYDGALKQPLLAFAFSYFVLTIIWSEIRKAKYSVAAVLMNMETSDQPLFKRVRAYKVLTLFFISTVICFAIYPAMYQELLPIAFLKTPILNIVGLAVLAVSLLLGVLTQMDIDRELDISLLTGREASIEQLSVFAGRMAQCYFLTFIGLSIILANVAILLLLSVACGLYIRNRD